MPAPREGFDPDEVAPWETGESGLRLTAAASVPLDRASWAWQDRIPAGGVTLAPGVEGQGKTTFVAHLAARLTRGDLPGDFYGRPADVVYIGNEDDRSTVLVPRLVAAGADLDRFFFVEMPQGASFSVAVDTEALFDAVRDRHVAAVILDPVDAHLGVLDSHRKAEVQGSLGKLAQLTQHLRCAGVGIAHFNKGDSQDVLRKVVGSVGLTTSVRSVIGIGQHPDNPEERVAVLVKANMTDKSAVPAVRFRLEGAAIPHPDGGEPIKTARVVLLGEQLGLDPNSILSSPDGGEDGQDAAQVLAQVLADGPLWAKEAVDAMVSAGFSKDQAKRAKAKIGAKAKKYGKPGDAEQGWKWELPVRVEGSTEERGVSVTAPTAPFAPFDISLLSSGVFRSEESEEREESQGSGSLGLPTSGAAA